MKFFVENWYMIFVVILFTVLACYCLYYFFNKPTSVQIQMVKKWLLWAVTQAEKELGGGTGQLKLRYVYNMFIERFSSLAGIITFEMISEWVDEALAEMKKMLGANVAAQNYVIGTEKESEVR